MLGKHALRPGEKTDLRVKFDTDGRPGPFEKKVTIITGGAQPAEIEAFTIRGTVKEAPAAKIAANPRKILLEPGEARNQAVSLTNEGSLPLTISKIRSRDGGTVYFDGAKEGPMVIEPGQTKTVELSLKAETADGRSQDYVVIESNARNAGKTGYLLIVQYGARK